MTVVACVAVQQQLRLFRDGLGQLLDAEDDIDVVGVARTAEELVALCTERMPHVVVLDAGAREWEVHHLAATLRHVSPSVTLIGVTNETPRSADYAHARRGGLSALVCRNAGVAEIINVIRTGRRSLRPLSPASPPPRRLSTSVADGAPSLTERERAILNLVAGGFSSKEISARLVISHKTVENHKQRILRKLGVQNQAHAVRIALGAGLLRLERVLAASD